ncbi:MAG: sodium:proton antiporter [Xanthobacteraceae bacterium]|jgi:multisubunit Na+/H+ antiporter MnhB subunit|nr:sodium:proton antiporter [Xanthobacteraceae bacterium]
MMAVFDIVLALLVLGVALLVTHLREARSAVIAFIALGLLLALVWVRLGSVDVALTEAAIGGGATGILLLRACGRLRPSVSDVPQASIPVHLIAGMLRILLVIAIAIIVLTLPEPAPSLAPQAAAAMPELGLGNPVTAVLLGFRALDTLLEKVVLLLALVGVWSLTQDGHWGGAPATLDDGPAQGPLNLLARVLPPIGIVAAIYLVWAGADHPGGTFQGGAVLAGMWLLAMMAGLAPPPETAARWVRLALFAGPALFLAVGFAGFFIADGFLSYPPGLAKPIIVAMEVALTLSIAAIIALMVAGPAAKAPR